MYYLIYVDDISPKIIWYSILCSVMELNNCRHVEKHFYTNTYFNTTLTYCQLDPQGTKHKLGHCSQNVNTLFKNIYWIELCNRLPWATLFVKTSSCSLIQTEWQTHIYVYASVN